MIPSVTARKLALSAAFVFLTTAMLAQAPPKYDPGTETTFKATVGELKFVPPDGKKSLAYLITTTGPDKDKDKVQIFLCPKSFLDDMGVAFKADDAIEVTGSKVKQDGTDLILAREVAKKDGDTLTLRFKDGKPAW